MRKKTAPVLQNFTLRRKQLNRGEANSDGGIHKGKPFRKTGATHTFSFRINVVNFIINIYIKKYKYKDSKVYSKCNIKNNHYCPISYKII